MNQYAVIIDFSHFFHMAYGAALNAGPRYEFSNTINKNAEGKLRTIRREFQKLRIVGYDLVFAEDRPATRKLELYPPYRGDRVDRSEDKRKLRDYLITELGYAKRFCHSDGNEADDVIATLVRRASQSPGMFSVIISSDRDLWQLLGPTTMIYNPVTHGGRRGMTEPEDVWKAFKCLPRHVPLVKSLWGDAGDSVPNAVPRMQKPLLPVVRETDGTLTDFNAKLELVWNTLSLKCRETYTAGKAQVAINYDLVKLDQHCVLEWD